MNVEIKKIDNWQTLLHLEKLYLHGETNKRKDNDYFRYLEDYNRIDTTSYKSKIIATVKYSSFYKSRIMPDFLKYKQFLSNNKIEHLANYFLISDIDSLINIEHDKSQIISKQQTRRQVSSRYFANGDAKYLKNNLEKAVKEILQIEKFPEDNKEQQYINILHSKKTAKKILLCENEDRLINPRQSEIEIWYAGGKNISKLKYVPKPEIPIFYLCDWDYDGLKIYLTIKQEYLENISLIIPKSYTKKEIAKTKHKSKWKPDFDTNYFNIQEQKIILDLIPDFWIEEESIDYN